jgi:hypothetical protein
MVFNVESSGDCKEFNLPFYFESGEEVYYIYKNFLGKYKVRNGKITGYHLYRDEKRNSEKNHCFIGYKLSNCRNIVPQENVFHEEFDACFRRSKLEDNKKSEPEDCE